MKTTLAMLGATGLIALAGCSAEAEPAATVSNGDAQDVSIAVFNGWPEGEAVSHLWAAVLEDEGYNVSLEYADVATVFTGLSAGDYDMNMDVWLPGTHATYVEKYGDDIVDLGAWNTEASLTVAVNEDAPIDSLAELAANGDLFGNRIVGIEPGAGLTAITQDAVMPSYGLDGFELTTSSTAGMLAELTAATDAGENIAVTLWHPHWAYAAFPIKDLADPEGALGEAEGLHSFSRTAFSDDFPTLNDWVTGFTMDSAALDSLQNDMFGSGADASDYDQIVADWIAENQDWVDTLTA
ncbi:MAG: glycine betaine ABC transporter substrate-binding protein [Burkholderiaceae bacterium]|nr:glycine betaine ABC transporter substrate-binding protein [Microbacteriaceae bacterium]